MLLNMHVGISFGRSTPKWLLIFLLLLKTLIANAVQTYESLDVGEQELRSIYLPKNITSRPVDNSSAAVRVNVTMRIVRLDSVDEKRQSVRMKLHIRYEWQNSFINWKPDNYNGVEELTLSEEEIWAPPIQLFNEASRTNGEYFEDKDRTILVTSHGICSTTYAQFFKSTCDIDVGDFPFDKQECDLVFGSWSLDERMLLLQAVNEDGKDEGLYTENGEWNLTKAYLVTDSVQYQIQRRRHSIVKLKITLLRKEFYFVMNLVIPCAMIASMIFLVFLLPAKSGERISLGITVMLSMAIFQELSSEKLPSSSDNFPLLGVYYATSMCEIGVALVANCFILNIFYREYEMPVWLRRLLFDKLSRIVRIDVPHTRMQHYIENLQIETFQELDMISESEITNPISNLNSHENGKGLSNGDVEVNYAKREIKKSLSLSADPAIRTEERKLLTEDWKTAARILDRIMLILATSVGVLSFIIIFCQAPRFREMLTA